MPLLVRLRPNTPYLLFVLLAVTLTAYGVILGNVFGVLIAAGGGALLALFGLPMLISTVFRVPAVAIDARGIRLPLMGVRLRWSEISSVSRGAKPSGLPVLLIIPTAPDAALGQVRPWLRAEARSHLAQHGTPIVVSGQSMDHSVEDILSAIHQHYPAPLA
ncbi:hypothetical protein [Micromonospora sp. NPDC005806]|uniref:hypothetical protein n=1 Tax=Micromonospora sp. NPDC005806 TaxID=3364234 RepID=UPI00367BE51A